MRELERGTYIAGGENPWIAGLKIVIHVHAAFGIVFDARAFESQPVDVGQPACADEDRIDFYLARRTASLQAQSPRRRAARDICDLASGDQLDALVCQRACDDC